MRRTSQAQTDSCYVLESLNHLVFGQLQASILNGPLQHGMAAGGPGQPGTVAESQMFSGEDGRPTTAERSEEQARLQKQIERTLDQFLSENKQKLTQLGLLPPGEPQALHPRASQKRSGRSRRPLPNQQMTLSNISALTCGQVSEVSSQGEASAPNFAPKIMQPGAPHAAAQLPAPGGPQHPGVKLVAHSFSLEADATHHPPESQDPPLAPATHQEAETKRRPLPLGQPKAGGHKDPEADAEPKGKGGVGDEGAAVLTAKGQDDGQERDRRFADDAARAFPGAA